MTSSQKMDLLLDIYSRGNNVKIITVNGEEFYCKLRCPAEDEDDWAFHVIVLDSSRRHLTLECNYVKSIEEIKKPIQIENLEVIPA